MVTSEVMKKLSLNRRGVALILAILLAAGGSALLFDYVRGIEDRALAGTDPLEVLVAKTRIPAGTTVAQASANGWFEKRKLPEVAVLDGAIGSVAAIKGEAAIVDVLEGEQILGARFASPSEARGLLPIPDGRQAMTVDAALPPSVAGYIEAGDHVSVIAKVDDPKPRTKFVLQDVQVLTVGRRSADGNDAGTRKGLAADEERGLYTLAVTPAEAEKLAFAVMQGEIYFTLLPPGQKPSGTTGRTAENLFS